MQKKINLSIQIPNDKSMLPMHSDIMLPVKIFMNVNLLIQHNQSKDNIKINKEIQSKNKQS